MKRWAVIAMFVTLALVAATPFVPFLRLTALVAVGRGNGCSWWRAMQVRSHAQELTRVKDRILTESQLVKTDPEGRELYATPHGLFWSPKGSRFVLPFNLAEQATGIYGKGRDFVRPGEVVLDCGANVGVFTRFALNAGARLVVAIEPAPDNVECLRRNFESEISAGRVVVVAKGVWDREDELELLVDELNQAADSFVERREGARSIGKIPVTKIDTLVDQLKLEKVDFIKMDIEGAEVKAVRGARQTLRRHRPRLALSVYHEPSHPREVPEAVMEATPQYRMVCGPCSLSEGRLHADILYFY